MIPKRLLLPILPVAIAASATAATIQLTNANFNTDIAAAETVVTAWTSVAGAGTNSTPSNYFQETVPGFTGNRVALIKSDGGNYIQQTLTLSDLGAVDATTFGSYTVGFDFGYRRDGATNGDLSIRVSLWNVTDNLEITGQDFTITNPGVGANSLSGRVANLNYDNAAGTLTGDAIALRVTSTSADLAGTAWQRTGIVDNFVLTAVPEPSVALLGGLGVLGLLRRRR